MNMSLWVSLILVLLTLGILVSPANRSDSFVAVAIILVVVALIFGSMGASDKILDREIARCEQAGGTPVVRVGQVYSTLERCDP